MITKDHFEHIFDLAYPFQGKPRLASLLLGILIQCQELEETSAAISQLQGIETADWARLVQIAGVVGQIADTQDLETLRTKVRARVQINISDGSRPAVIAVLRKIMPAGEFEWLDFDGGVEIIVTGVSPAEDWHQTMVQEAYSSGLLVRLIFVTAGDFFAFGGGLGWGEPFGEIL